MNTKFVSIGIYPADWAAMNVANAGKPYCPSNGEEGQIFFEAWCSECARDTAMNSGADVDDCDDNQRCDIIGRTMAYSTTDPDYPSEWQYSKSGQPCCTAWVPAGEPIPAEKDVHTIDMFDIDVTRGES